MITAKFASKNDYLVYILHKDDNLLTVLVESSENEVANMVTILVYQFTCL